MLNFDSLGKQQALKQIEKMEEAGKNEE